MAWAPWRRPRLPWRPPCLRSSTPTGAPARWRRAPRGRL
ncbi:hypothetical protein EYF80_068312 [Liparis tanakae]|uniref:Uncharacterized protein n=1 Tax=Liparis tanakae TaxID=230148 RepID=A0A4Z2DYT0_9TELE|nr:hypothetical protein EYF80_068312 [Liparis tanakae]